MAKIVLCSEFSRGSHCLAKLADCAIELQVQGHSVRVVCADMTAAHQMPEFKKASIFQAPRANLSFGHKIPRPTNYSSLLIQQGYDSKENLTPILRAWLHLLATLDVDLVVTDHSPTALLAGKLLMTPCVMLGNGYMVPRRSNPLPSITPWKHEQSDHSDLIEEDKKVLDVVNQSVKSLKFDKVELKETQDIFSHAAQWIMSVPELDHYGGRDESYVVRWTSKEKAQTPVWPDAPGEKIFLHLDARSPHLQLVLEQLAKRGDPVLAVIPNADDELLESSDIANVKIQREHVDLKAAADQCRVFINHGGHGLVYDLLLHAMPSIMLPSNPENTLLAFRVAKRKLGFPGPAKPSRLNIDELIDSVLKNDQVWANASRFSLKYVNHEPLSRLPDLIAAQLPKK